LRRVTSGATPPAAAAGEAWRGEIEQGGPCDCERRPAGGGGGVEVADPGANCSGATGADVAGVDTALLVADEFDEVSPALSGTEPPVPDDPEPDAGPDPEDEVGGEDMGAALISPPLGTGVATPMESAADAPAAAAAGMLIISM
jgi:hypothetical protein